MPPFVLLLLITVAQVQTEIPPDLPLDPPVVLEAGWPLPGRLATSGWVVDLDQDGTNEILWNDRYISITALDGSQLVPPFQEDGVPAWMTAGRRPFVGDLDGDGDLEILTWRRLGVVKIYYAFHHTGEIVEGWPVNVRSTYHSFGDFTGDGTFELLFASGPELTSPCRGKLHILEGDGTPLTGWPVEICTGVEGTIIAVTAGDLDLDGSWEVCAVVSQGIPSTWWVFEGDGSVRAGWPRPGTGRPMSWAIADLDGDFDCEIITVDGNEMQIRQEHGQHFVSPDYIGSPRAVAIGDVTGDGFLDVVVAGLFAVWVVDVHNGTRIDRPLPGPREYRYLDLADFDGNGVTDILVHGDGGIPAVVYFFTGDLEYLIDPLEYPWIHDMPNHQVVQMDDDPALELLQTAASGIYSAGYLWEFPWTGPKIPSIEWGDIGHDLTGAGFYHHLNYPERKFVRGDVNNDGEVDVADAIAGSRFLFTGETYPCEAASDFDGNGASDVSDLVALMSYLFALGPAPPAPFPECEGNNGPNFPCQNFVCP